MNRYLHLLAGLVVLISGCDIVEEPYGPSDNGGGPPPVEGVRRRILLEDFTGHRCIYCPEAASIAQDLEEDPTIGPDLVVVALHVTDFFAGPVPPLGDGYYDNDFRTEAGTTYTNQWLPPGSGLPKGMVNRVPYNGALMLDRFAWDAAITEQLGQPALMDLWFSELTRNSSAGVVNAKVKVSVAEDLAGAEHKLVVYLLEDSIVGWQSDAFASPSEIPDYVHRHVLRDDLNSPWGDVVLTGTEAVGDTIEFALPAYTLNSGWNTEHLSLVAYVYNSATYEVMQVVEKYVP
jgi:hypothetical protein